MFTPSDSIAGQTAGIVLVHAEELFTCAPRIKYGEPSTINAAQSRANRSARECLVSREPEFPAVDRLLIAPDWAVIENRGSLAVVSREGKWGITPTSADVHSSWICGSCGMYGPWSGARCLSCGHLSDGDD